MRTVASIEPDVGFDIDAVRGVLRDHPVRLAILFGSHATGTAHAKSDIDIAVEFEGYRPSDTGYNDVFLGLSAELSAALETDAVDLVDLHTASPAMASAIFETGALIFGSETHAAELRRRLTESGSETRTPRERIDAALDRIDDHLDDTTAVPATGETEDSG